MPDRTAAPVPLGSRDLLADAPKTLMATQPRSPDRNLDALTIALTGVRASVHSSSYPVCDGRSHPESSGLARGPVRVVALAPCFSFDKRLCSWIKMAPYHPRKRTVFKQVLPGLVHVTAQRRADISLQSAKRPPHAFSTGRVSTMVQHVASPKETALVAACLEGGEAGWRQLLTGNHETVLRTTRRALGPEGATWNWRTAWSVIYGSCYTCGRAC